MPQQNDFDIEKVTREAKEYVAGLSDAEVRRLLNLREAKNNKKKADLKRKKELEKQIAIALEARAEEGE